MKKMFITDKVVEDYSASGVSKVKFIAELISITPKNVNSGIPMQMNATTNTDEVTVNIQYSVKAVSKSNLTTDEIRTPDNKDVYLKSGNEIIEAKLSEIAVPKINLVDFKSSKELHNYLEEYYLLHELNRLGKFGSTNWTEYELPILGEKKEETKSK